MRRLFLLALVFMPFLAQGEDLINKIEGDYKGNNSSSSLYLRTLVDPLENVVIAKVEVGTRNCTGDFFGTGTLKGNTIQLVPYKKFDKDDQCVITLTFDKTGTKAKVEETTNCFYYHGAACIFDGEVAKKR